MFSVRPLIPALRSSRNGLKNFIHTSSRKRLTWFHRPIIVGGTLIGSIGLYKYFENDFNNVRETVEMLMQPLSAAAKYPESQPSVFSPTKEHALYLWIQLSPKADAKKCASVVSKLQQHVDKVSPAALRDETNEIIAGVGFGNAFYAKINPKANKSFEYRERNGKLGKMPKTNGDIFIHAKSDNVSKLFELSELISDQLKGSLEKADDVYSFVYRNGRDLSGFIDGTENPADEEDRQRVAVEPGTGGSYVITQRWVHDLKLRSLESDSKLESYVGRSLEDSIELPNKSISSHVARMTGGTNLNQKKAFEIVRQSMPYGKVHGESGLFFIAYAASVENFEFQLNQMTGVSDGVNDDIMRLTTCVSGNYWYFPGVNELKNLAN